MLKWFRRARAPRRYPTDRDLIIHLCKRNDAMALDLSKLRAAVERNTKAVTAVVASHSDPAAQATVDELTNALEVNSAAAEVAVAAPAA